MRITSLTELDESPKLASSGERKLLDLTLLDPSEGRDPGEPLIQQICALSYRMRQIAVRDVLSTQGLDMRDWQVLSSLGELGLASQREVAVQTKLDKVAVNRSSTRLKERGLVLVRPNKLDGRSHLLELSSKGRKITDCCGIALKELEQEALSCFTPAESETLSALLLRLGMSIDVFGSKDCGD